jgi:inner membrane protein
MASAFGHAIASVGITVWNHRLIRLPRFWFLMILSAVIPDADAIGYKLGIPYGSPFGHRGFTHSILFATVWSGLAAFCCFRTRFKSAWVFIFAATLSHDLIDACTNGGLGVGFFIPWDNTRYFFPIHPIQVSPLSVARFFTQRGLSILRSEALWISIPVLGSITFRLLMIAIRSRYRPNSSLSSK